MSEVYVKKRLNGYFMKNIVHTLTLKLIIKNLRKSIFSPYATALTSMILCVTMYKIVYDTIDIKIPAYIKQYSGESRLRSSHLDSLSYISTLDPINTSTRSPLYKSFFFRSIHLWNSLPFNTRNCTNQITFKKYVKEFLWGKVNQNFIFDPH